MNLYCLLFISMLSYFFLNPLIAQENLDIYLCIGQSNMAGRAVIPDRDKDKLEGVFLLDSLGEWEVAKNPFNIHSSIRKQVSMQRMSPSYTFAKSLRNYLPETKIGLVVNAKGGSAIAEWMPGQPFFEDVLRRTRQATQTGTLKAILWHQGESDAQKTEIYLDSLAAFVKALRDSLDANSVPFIAGQTAEDPKREAINQCIWEIPSRIPRSTVVNSEGLTTSDGTHFDGKSTELLGERYASKVMHLVHNQWRVSEALPYAKPTFERIYKKIDTTELKLTFYYPPDFDKSKEYPTMIYFFGGGWNGGTPFQFQPHAQYFSQRGIITILADYRVKSRQGTSPYESVKDAKSAVRYLRQNSEELNIAPDKIIASGGSAGGHLAATTAMIEGLDEEGEDLSISSKPQALVLFNPVYDNGPGGYGFERVGGEAKFRTISPMHNIRKGAPPAIVFFGSRDPLVPVSTAQKFQWKMRLVGSKSELYIYEGEGHGFFNLGRSERIFEDTIEKTDAFLVELGFIK